MVGILNCHCLRRQQPHAGERQLVAVGSGLALHNVFTADNRFEQRFPAMFGQGGVHTIARTAGDNGQTPTLGAQLAQNLVCIGHSGKGALCKVIARRLVLALGQHTNIDR